jgi:glucose 1-dehydrogenase
MLSNQVAIVTGGARGIGRATALELARHGAGVAICDVCDHAGAAEAISGIERLGRRALYFQADVADRAAMDRMIAQTADRLGRLDILVNNASQSIRKPLLDLQVSDVVPVWNTILWGAFHCAQLAARRMVEQGQGGNIVMISSVHAYRPYPNASSYNGAKAAVNQMAATWAAELAQYRIRVNSIEPGWTDTPGERAFFTEEQLREGGSKLPFGRLGSPEDIAKAVRFLVSADGSYITGSCLRVDGGFVLPR